MSQKKITIELTKVEAAHAVTAIQTAQVKHHAEHGKRNPALDRVFDKLENATVAAVTRTKEATDAEADPADG